MLPNSVDKKWKKAKVKSIPFNLNCLSLSFFLKTNMLDFKIEIVFAVCTFENLYSKLALLVAFDTELELASPDTCKSWLDKEVGTFNKPDGLPSLSSSCIEGRLLPVNTVGLLPFLNSFLFFMIF